MYVVCTKRTYSHTIYTTARFVSLLHVSDDHIAVIKEYNTLGYLKIVKIDRFARGWTVRDRKSAGTKFFARVQRDFGAQWVPISFPGGKAAAAFI